MSLDVGDKAPDFTMPTDGGGEVSLAKLKGKPVVLYFYPRDDTPGCTKEACGFRDALPDFSGVGATEAYGVWVEKNMYGRKSMGIERSTFLIDGDGVIRGVWRKVKVPGHVDAVLAAAKEL